MFAVHIYFIKKIPSFLFYMCECSACMYVFSMYYVHAWYAQRLKEGIIFPAPGVTDDCKPLCEC